MNNSMQSGKVLIGDCIQNLRQKHKIKRSEYLPSGAIPVIDQGRKFIAGYINDTERAYDGKLPVLVFGDHTCTLKYVDFPFAVGAEGTQLIRPTKKFDIRYLYYALQNLPLEHFGYQRHFKYLKTSKIFCPPMKLQHKIASILSIYDNLIENNTRRIKILEDMVEALYREWFVHYRFPGHENVPMVKSSLGSIPQGWIVKRLDEVAQLHRGRSYRSINLVEDGEGFPFLNLKNINREGGFRSDGLKWYSGEFKETQVAVSNDIIMALTDVTQDRKVVARSARVPDLGYKKYVFSMDLLKIEPDELIQVDFLYALLKYSSFAERLKEYANGTTVLHLSPSHVQSAELVLPPDVFRHRYVEIGKSARQQSDLLEKKNVNLCKIRDLLLPKLISGEIDVSEIDIDIGRILIPDMLTDRLHSDEKILGGNPVIKGTRLAVSFILNLLEQGWNEEEIIANYPSIAHEDIEACLIYQEKGTRASVSR